MFNFSSNFLRKHKERKKMDFIPFFPKELIRQIFSYLNAIDLFSASLVLKKLNQKGSFNYKLLKKGFKKMEIID